jgi:hypothetical protein
MLWSVIKSKKTDGDFSPPADGRMRGKSIRIILANFLQVNRRTGFCPPWMRKGSVLRKISSRMRV